MGWVVLAMTVIGGLGVFAFERLADTEQSASSKTKLRHFANWFAVLVVVGAGTGIYEQIQSDKNTLEKIQEGIDSVTGGDGFVYLVFPKNSDAPIEIKAEGEYTQHILEMGITGMNREGEQRLISYPERFISPYAKSQLSRKPYMSDDDESQVFMAIMICRNCELYQIVGTHLRDDGTYSIASFVYRRKHKLINPLPVYRKVDDDFPPEIASELGRQLKYGLETMNSSWLSLPDE